MNAVIIPSVLDKRNVLQIHRASDGDLGLVTHRITNDADDCVIHLFNTTLRTNLGGGRYDRAFSLQDYKVKPLRYYFAGMRRKDALNLPLLQVDLPENMDDTPFKADVLTFPADDGGNHLGFHLLQANHLVGVQTYDKHDSADDRNIIVWLGDSKKDTFLEAMWNRAMVTQQHYQHVEHNPDFMHRNMTVQGWVR